MTVHYRLETYNYLLDNCNNLLVKSITNKSQVRKIKSIVLKNKTNISILKHVFIELDKIQSKYKVKDVYRQTYYKIYKNEEYD